MSGDTLEHKIFSFFGVLLFALPLAYSRPLWNELLVVLTAIVIGGLLLRYLLLQHGARLVLVLMVMVLCFHAQWGVAQFILQRDLGLHVLGESRLSPDRDAVAKFLVGDQKLLRAYGPYRHANPFGGVMVLGLVFLSFLRLVGKRGAPEIFFSALFFTLVLGVIVSFSRMAYGAVFLLAPFAWWRHGTDQRFRLGILLLVILLSLAPLIGWRMADAEDVAIAERWLGFRWAREIIASQAVWRGVQLPYREALRLHLDHGHIPYQPWQIDYVHSIPLLLAVKLGVIPAAAMLVLGLGLCYVLAGNKILWLVPLVPLVTFDHYLLTQPETMLIALFGYVSMLAWPHDVTLEA